MPLWDSTLSGQPRIGGFLERLAAHPPNSLLLEGGTAGERLGFGLFWTALLNCRAERPPCGACPICTQIQGNAFRDLILLDGGEVFIKVEDIREIRSTLSDPPSGSGRRVVILAEAQVLEAPSANALLKSLEEPCPGNVFVLLAPSREVLLPTLVSRSFTLTLRWPRADREDPELRDWMRALSGFIQSGRGAFLEWTAKKGGVDAPLAGRILGEVQRSLVQTGYGAPQTDLAHLLSRLDATAARRAGVIADSAQESLAAGANFGLVLEWTAVRLWSLAHGRV